MSGRFITLEGIDGAGKTTHMAWIASFLSARGIEVTTTREPGGTPAGEALRTLLLGGAQRLRPETETLLIFAARQEHLETVIKPALKAGRWVLCDRFTDATFAYQGGGSGVPWDKIVQLEKWVQGEIQPDLTILLDVTPQTARERSSRIKDPDRFEKEGAAFHERVRAAYLRRAREHASRIRVVDANRGQEEVKKELQNILASI